MYVVITGASRGIGKELAIIFAKHKYNLMLNCKDNIEKLEELKKELVKNNINVFIKKGHFSEEDFDKIDDIILTINNAGQSEYNLCQDTTLERFDELVDANLKDCFITTKYSIKNMLKRKEGLIINISSVYGVVGASNESLYSMTKGGIITFTKSIAKELAFSNINCISLSLGMVDTDMIKNIDNEYRKNFEKENEKIFSPIEIAEKIYDIFLYKKYNTGENIIINNGLK